MTRPRPAPVTAPVQEYYNGRPVTWLPSTSIQTYLMGVAILLGSAVFFRVRVGPVWWFTSLAPDRLPVMPLDSLLHTQEALVTGALAGLIWYTGLLGFRPRQLGVVGVVTGYGIAFAYAALHRLGDFNKIGRQNEAIEAAAAEWIELGDEEMAARTLRGVIELNPDDTWVLGYVTQFIATCGVFTAPFGWLMLMGTKPVPPPSTSFSSLSMFTRLLLALVRLFHIAQGLAWIAVGVLHTSGWRILAANYGYLYAIDNSALLVVASVPLGLSFMALGLIALIEGLRPSAWYWQNTGSVLAAFPVLCVRILLSGALLINLPDFATLKDPVPREEILVRLSDREKAFMTSSLQVQKGFEWFEQPGNIRYLTILTATIAAVLLVLLTTLTPSADKVIISGASDSPNDTPQNVTPAGGKSGKKESKKTK